MYARRRPGRSTIGIVLPDSLEEIGGLEQVVAHHRPEATACISEKVLGIDRKLLTATGSEASKESSLSPGPIEIRASERRESVAAIERHRSEVKAGKLLCPVHYGRSSRSTPYSRKKT